VLSVVVPGVLFASFVPNWKAVHTFWLVHQEPFVRGLAGAAILGVIGAGIAGAVWLGASAGRRPAGMARACVVVLLVAGLLPGVLVGSATAAAWNWSARLRWLGDSSTVVILGQLARYGFLPGLIGVVLARSEPEDERASRRLDGADGLFGWARACLPWGAGSIAAAGMALGILGFHEIEASVILQPPGVDSFARQMLQFLHYARTQELCVGALLTMAVGLALAALVAAVDRLAGIRWGRL
jgi:ABC-type Fe3+ transport system permease subunit